MTIIESRIKQLTSVFGVYNKMSSEEQSFSINYISEFLTSASLLQKISGDENLKEQLDLFQENFQRNFGADLRKLGASDLPENLVKISQEIRKIDDTDLSLDEKRAKVTEIFSKHHLSRDKFVEKISEQTQNKYQFAHLRNALNYGEYVDFLATEISTNPENKAIDDELKSNLRTIQTTDNELDFFKSLVTINQLLDLTKNFDKLQVRFNLDGMEEHSLINQSTQFRSNLDQSQLLKRIENEQGEDFDKKTSVFFKKIQELKKNQKIQQTISQSPVSEKSIPQITLGFEMESIITAKGGLSEQKKFLQTENNFQKIIYNTADLDSRAKMRETYGFSSEKIGRNINPLIIYSESEIEGFDRLNYEKNREKIDVVKKFLEQEKAKYGEDNKKIFNDAIKNIGLLTKEEIYFLELFYVKKDQAKNHKLTMDDVFDWRDSEQYYQEKLLTTLKDIAYKGGFYKKTLDMIRASEIAIGEFESHNADTEFSQAIEFMRNTAKEHNLSLQDRNVQINIGLNRDGDNLFKISDKIRDGKLQLFSNEITGDFAKIIQQTLLQTIQSNPEFERKGQGLVGIAVKADRKKGLIDKTRDTEYFTYYNPLNPSSELLAESSAFPVHRQNTGKSENIRLSRIKDNEDAVFEVRLVANNPHCPYFDDKPRIIDNASEGFTKIFKTNLEQNWQEYLGDKNPQQINAKIDAKIAIDKDGNLVGTNPEIRQTASYPVSPLKSRSSSNHL